MHESYIYLSCCSHTSQNTLAAPSATPTTQQPSPRHLPDMLLKHRGEILATLRPHLLCTQSHPWLLLQPLDPNRKSSQWRPSSVIHAGVPHSNLQWLCPARANWALRASLPGMDLPFACLPRFDGVRKLGGSSGNGMPLHPQAGLVQGWVAWGSASPTPCLLTNQNSRHTNQVLGHHTGLT